MTHQKLFIFYKFVIFRELIRNSSSLILFQDHELFSQQFQYYDTDIKAFIRANSFDLSKNTVSCWSLNSIFRFQDGDFLGRIIANLLWTLRIGIQICSD